MAKKKRRKVPIYQRQIEESDLLWLVEEYKREVNLNPDITVEKFAQQHGIETKLLSQYLLEPNSKRSRITLWHGTTGDRAKAIVKEGFKVRKAGGRIWFSRNPNVSRSIAQSKANQRGEEPVVFQCQIDLEHYTEYDRQSPINYSFKSHTISNAVITRVEGWERKRIKNAKQKKRQRQLVDVGINEASNELVIVYWINSYLKLEGEDAVSIHHPAVTIIQDWVNTQYSGGRETPISDEEMLHLVMIHLPEHFDW